MRYFKKKDRIKINLIHDDDLVGYLKSLGVYEGVKSGKYNCCKCGNKINIDNLSGLYPTSDKKICFICNENDCINKL